MLNNVFGKEARTEGEWIIRTKDLEFNVFGTIFRIMRKNIDFYEHVFFVFK